MRGQTLKPAEGSDPGALRGIIDEAPAGAFVVLREPLNVWHPIDKWSSPAPWYSPPALWWVGLSAALIYAALRLLAPQVGAVAGTLVALTGLIAVLTWGRGIRGSAPLWLLLAAIIVQVLSWGLLYWQHPEWAAANPRLDRMAKWFLFIGLAWWLGGSTRHTLLFWGVALLGLLLVVSVGEHGVPHWQRAFENWRFRPSFGLMNAQHAAMFFGAALIGGLAFAGRCWRSGCLAWPRRLAWLGIVGVCLLGTVLTQTRGVWLSLLLAALAMAVAVLCWLWVARHPRHLLRWLALGLCGVVIVGLAVGLIFRDTVERRLGHENTVIALVVQGEFDQVPYTSVGVRVHTWRAAGEWFLERPLVGWGDDARGLVIRNTEWLPDNVRERFGHLHNTPLEILVAYGLLGLGVMLTLGAWVGLGAWRAWRGGVMPGDMALFGLGFFVFFVVINQFESYLSFWTGTFLFNLVLGGLVTHIWRWQVECGRGVLLSPPRVVQGANAAEVRK